MLLENLDVKNVAILVGDAVRWDFSKDSLSKKGKTYKTIAASHHTPTSFATMLSGADPVQHGVQGFRQHLPPEVEHIFNISSHNTYFSKGYINEWLANQQQIFGSQPQKHLSEIDPPFVWVNRDYGGHAPYNGFYENGEHVDLNAKEYFERFAGDVHQLRADYSDAIRNFHQRVERTINTLENLGLQDDTLLIVTSDHGELLGEHGQVGHDFPACPELVTVPTTFIHPDIDSGLVESQIVRHIDLIPTILGMTDINNEMFKKLPGIDISEQIPNVGICFYNRAFSDIIRTGLPATIEPTSLIIPQLLPRIVSVWDADGGHVFNTAAQYQRLLIFLLRVVAMPEGRHIIRKRSFCQAFSTLLSSVVTYGKPTVSQDVAKELAESYRHAGFTPTTRELTDEQRQHLNDLGYL